MQTPLENVPTDNILITEFFEQPGILAAWNRYDFNTTIIDSGVLELPLRKPPMLWDSSGSTTARHRDVIGVLTAQVMLTRKMKAYTVNDIRKSEDYINRSKYFHFEYGTINPSPDIDPLEEFQEDMSESKNDLDHINERHVHMDEMMADMMKEMKKRKLERRLSVMAANPATLNDPATKPSSDAPMTKAASSNRGFESTLAKGISSKGQTVLKRYV